VGRSSHSNVTIARALVGACAGAVLLGLDACSTYAEDTGHGDGGDGPGADGSVDGATVDGAATDGGAGGTYHDMTDRSFWECFPLGTINFNTPSHGVFSDGRFVYYGSTSSTWLRFDRSKGFGETSAWTKLDATTIGAGASGTGSLAFDGRYGFYALASQPRLARFDTVASADKTFGDVSQWKLLPIPDGGPPVVHGTIAVGQGTGELLYASPIEVADASSIAARFTPEGLQWETMDVAKISGGDPREWGAPVTSGGYVYWLSGDRMLRFDTTKTFTAPDAWEIFMTTSIPGGANGPPQPLVGFSTTTFDGRYVYFAPRAYATVLRYDTMAPFSSASSWSWFKVTKFGSAFQAATFDGRFVYFVPGTGTTTVVRYDSLADFTNDASWSTFDLTTVAASGINGFGGAGFDGRWVYLVPNNAYTTCRFDARTP